MTAEGRGSESGAERDKAGRTDGARSTGAALEAHYRFILWLVPTVERFPRSHRFLLGDRIQSTAMGVLERLIEALIEPKREDRGVTRFPSELRQASARTFEMSTHP